MELLTNLLTPVDTVSLHNSSGTGALLVTSIWRVLSDRPITILCQVSPAQKRQLDAEWREYTTQMRSLQANIDELQHEKEGTRRNLNTVMGMSAALTMRLLACRHMQASQMCAVSHVMMDRRQS